MAGEYVYMPNEIFFDLKLNIPNSSQIAFSYSYIYYITFLYRYCKYIDNNGIKVTQGLIKQFLGYSPKNKKIDYIIKKGGILDNMNYTVTTTDYPLQYLYDRENTLLFENISAYKGIIKNLNDRNFRIKIPLKSFFRTPLDYEEGNLTGTFYEVENTHRIDYQTFHSIVTDKELGTVAFYLYGYLRHKTNLFPTGYQRSAEKIGRETGLSERTIRKYINLLESHYLIHVERKLFNLHYDEEDYEANIYNII
jgi:hypothetical protein